MRANYIWNIIGSMVNALFYTVLLMAVNRILGSEQGGVFSIGYAIAMLMWVIGSFETMTFQVTDAKKEYSFRQYHAAKIVLCAAMAVASLVRVQINQRSGYEYAVILFICLFKLIDAYTGVFYAGFQARGRLDRGGKSQTARILIATVVMILMMLLTKNLLVAVIAACVAEIVWMVLYDYRLTARVTSLAPDFSFEAIKGIVIACFPLFISSFLLTYLTNLPKYTMDAVMTMEDQAAFGALFMPAAVINLLSLFAFRPLLTEMAKLWAEKKRRRFIRLILRIFLLILALTVLAVIVAATFGAPVLAWIFHVPISGYRLALVLIMVGGGFSAGVSFAVNVLTVMRRQVYVVAGYVLSVVIARLIAKPLITKLGMTGAGLIYCIAMGCAFLFIGAILLFALRRSGGRQSAGEAK